MSEIIRYTATCDIKEMERDERGFWVKHSDYKQILIEKEKAEAEVERLRYKQAEMLVMLLKYTNTGNEDFIDDAIRVCGGGEG